MSISNTLFKAFDINALKVKSNGASIAIASTNVSFIGPKSKVLEAQEIPTLTGAVFITGTRLNVTIRDSNISNNGHTGLFFKSLAGSEVHLWNVRMLKNEGRGIRTGAWHIFQV